MTEKKKAATPKAPSTLKKADINFMHTYLNNASPTGAEYTGQQIWLDFLKPHVNEVSIDRYGTAVAVINPEAKFKVVIEAHADEIGWYVNYITDSGMIHVVRNGGSDHQIAPSKRVNIHTKDGIVKGVFGWPAIHTRRGAKEDPKPEVHSITIDVGCSSKEEVEKLGIHVGCMITYEDELMVLNDRYYVGRGLDNRMGGFMIAQVAKRVSENKDKLPFGLYIVNSVQEEIGLRGAEMIVQQLKPDMAIITDVCHDTSTPFIDKTKEGDTVCGKGPVISYAPSIHHTVREWILDTAAEKKIPFQRMANSTYTGTDTDAFAYNGAGVPSALISLPLKYMHTTVESTHKDDVEWTIELMYETLKKIDPNNSFKYLDV